jgi:hypothetical protein
MVTRMIIDNVLLDVTPCSLFGPTRVDCTTKFRTEEHRDSNFFSRFSNNVRKLCHSSGGLSPASHRGGSSSSTGHVMWDLW